MQTAAVVLGGTVSISGVLATQLDREKVGGALSALQVIPGKPAHAASPVAAL